jgi:GH35 family endo-1,4-beta-xylanase
MLSVLLASVALAGNLISNPDFSAGTEGWQITASEFCQREIVSSDRGGKSVKLDLKQIPGAPGWEVQCQQQINSPLKQGQVLEFSFWARSITRNKINAFVQAASAPYSDVMSREVVLTPEWQSYKVSGIANASFAAKQAQAGFHLNFGTGTVELASVSLEAIEPVPLAKPERLLNAPKLSDWRTPGVTLSNPAGQLLSKFVVKRGASPWDNLIGVPLDKGVVAGQTVSVSLQMRSRTKSRATVHIEESNPPNAKYVSGPVTLTPTWQAFRFAGIVPKSLAPKEGQLTIFLGYETGEVELKELVVENLGFKPLSEVKQTIQYYASGKRDLSWLAAAEARIEKQRRGPLVVNVVRDGKPLAGAKVQVEMLRHAFRFGTAAPAALINADDATSTRFKAQLKSLFNTVTLENDLKWTDTDANGYEAPDKAIAWLTKNGFNVRGHNGVWGSERNIPAGAWAMKNDVLKDRVSDRVEEVVTRYKGQLYLWDVVNEAVTETSLWDRIGWETFGQVFRIAKVADPTALTAYNDYNITEEAQAGTGHKQKAKERVQQLLNQGAPVDIIGIQAHVGTPMTPMPTVFKALDEMAALGPRLEITEYDLGVQDDKVHAEHMADFLTTCFSHPKVDGFIMWGFWEGAHWRANEGGAMIRRDWTARPTVKAYRDLVFKKWWTNETANSDSNGMAKFRPFYGTHKIKVTVGTVTREFIGEILPGDAATFRVNWEGN